MKSFISWATVLFALFICFSCSKEVEISDSKYLSKYGYLMIQSIEIVRESGNQPWITFSYNGNEQLVQAVRNDDVFTFDYDEDNRLLQIIKENPALGTSIKVDSFVYDQSDRIIAKYGYSHVSDPAEQSVLWQKEAYEYDAQGRITAQVLTFLDNDVYERVTEYDWKDNNFKSSHLITTGDTWYRAAYKFDNRVNYRLHHPYFLMEDVVQTENNVTQINYSDLDPLLDLACDKCEFEYKFNSGGAVIEETLFNGVQQFIINYD
ncbi:MAG: hypothetical protein AB8G22_22910 [Saprospiraceae bacterium]